MNRNPQTRWIALAIVSALVLTAPLAPASHVNGAAGATEPAAPAPPSVGETQTLRIRLAHVPAAGGAESSQNITWHAAPAEEAPAVWARQEEGETWRVVHACSGDAPCHEGQAQLRTYRLDPAQADRSGDSYVYRIESGPENDAPAPAWNVAVVVATPVPTVDA